jgi:protein gp37
MLLIGQHITHSTMLLQNPIGWCDDTTNAATGCDKISPGCKNCYAATGTRARVLRAQGIETWGPNGVRHPVAQMTAKLRRLNKLCLCDNCHQTAPIAQLGKTHECQQEQTEITEQETSLRTSVPSVTFCSNMGLFRRIRLFADSNSDWLDDKWPIEVFAKFLDQIRQAPNIDVLLLTKRPENFIDRMRLVMNSLRCNVSVFASTPMIEWMEEWNIGKAPENLWLGASVENQKCADERIPALLKIPAAIRFLSCEPLLESVDLTFCLPWKPEFEARKVSSTILKSQILRRSEISGVDWVIVGGESGKDRRDCYVEPIATIANQCLEAGVPVYVKQDSAFKSGQQGRIPDDIWRLKQFPSAPSASSCKKSGTQFLPSCFPH